MDQIALTKKAGTSRKWLVEVEQGKPRAEIGLILRALKSLGVSVDLKADSSHETTSIISNARTPDINSVLDPLKKRHDESTHRSFGWPRGRNGPLQER